MANNCDLYDEALKSGPNCFTVDDDDGEYPTTRSYEGSPTCINEYTGFQPPQGVTILSERVAVSEISPQQFFSDYVSHRKPVAIAGHLKDSEWAGHRWTNAYLRAKAGKAKVLVEKRPESYGAAGLGAFGAKSDMEYGKFLTEIELGHEGFYMTTQDLERDESDLDEYGMPQSVLAEPLRSLIGEFPLRPSLLGNLIPYQLSLWQGSSRAGASSGLHHDYHDNLYVLLRGRKRFRLFPPSAAKYLRTTGVLTKVHTNGLIVYEFKQGVRTVNIRSDGVPLAFLARRKREDAEAEIVDAEDDLLCLHDDAGKARRGVEAEEVRRLQALIGNCEERIDEAMRETIRYGDVSDDDDDEVISIKDSDDDDEASEPVAKQARLDTSTEESDKHRAVAPPPPLKLETNFCNVALPRGDSIEELEAFLLELRNTSVPTTATKVAEKMDTSESANALESTAVPETPVGESNTAKKAVDASETNVARGKNDTTKVDESLFSVPLGCLVVHLEPGEMLYIPASWFHEVTSFDDNDPIASVKDGETAKSGDVAVVTDLHDKVNNLEGKVADLEDKVNDLENRVMSGPLQGDTPDKCAGSNKSEIIATDTETKIGAGDTSKTKVQDASETKTEDASDMSNAATEAISVPETVSKDPESSVANSLSEAVLKDAETSEAVSGITNPSSEPSSLKKPEVVAENAQNLKKDQSDVESTNLLTSKTLTVKTSELNRGHLAFNYWTFPPDGKNFSSPYAGEFWPRRWKEIELLRRTMGIGAGRPPPPTRVINADTSVITLDSDSQEEEDDEEENEDEEEYSSDCYTMDEGSSLIYEGSSSRSPKQRQSLPSRPMSHARCGQQQAVAQMQSVAMHHGHATAIQQRSKQFQKGTTNANRAVTIDDSSNFCEIIDEDSSEGEEVGSTNVGTTDKNNSHGDNVEERETGKENGTAGEASVLIGKDSIAKDSKAVNGNGSEERTTGDSTVSGEKIDAAGGEETLRERTENNEDGLKSSNGVVGGVKMETNGAEDKEGDALKCTEVVAGIKQLSNDDERSHDVLTLSVEKDETSKILDASDADTLASTGTVVCDKSQQKGLREKADVEADLDNILDEGDDDTGLDDAIDDGLLDDNTAAAV